MVNSKKEGLKATSSRLAGEGQFSLGKFYFLRYPLTWIVLFLLVGFLGRGLWRFPPFFGFLLLFSCLTFQLLFKRKFIFYFIFFALFWLVGGSLLYTFVFELPYQSFSRWDREKITVQGYLIEKNGNFFLTRLSGFPVYSPTIRLRESSLEEIPTHQKVEITGVFRLFPSCSNPGVRNWNNFWGKRRVVGDLTPASYQIYPDKSPWHSFLAWVGKVRSRVLENWREKLPKTYPLFSALLTGQREEGFYHYSEELERAGVFHLFCVSGLHLGILGGAALFLLGRLFFLRKISFWLVAGLTFLYLVFCSFSPSSLRAWLMLSAHLFERRVGRGTPPFAFLLTAFFFMFLLQPESIFLPGAQLSYASTFGIIFFVNHIQFVFQNKNWLTRFLGGSLFLTASALVGSFPVLVSNGFSFSTLSFLGNILLVPLIQLALLLSFLGAMVGWVSLVSFSGLAFLIETLLSTIQWIVSFLVQIPHLFLQFNTRATQLGGWGAWLGIVGIFLIFSLLKGKKRFFLGAVWGGVILLLITGLTFPRAQFWVLDIGQGLSNAFIYGDSALLIDTGGIIRGYGNTGSSIVVPFLRYQGVKRIENIFFTHSHQDHIGGWERVVSQLPVEGVTAGAKNISLSSEIIPFTDYTVIHSLNGCQVEVFPIKGREENNRACVYRLHYPSFRVLVTGDIEGEGIDLLLQYGKRNLEAEILILPHHGKLVDGLEKLLEATNPKVAIVSAGENSYGHPDPRALSLVLERGIELYQTNQNGAIAVWEKRNGGWRLNSFGKAVI
ncbi:MAG: competence protein ComEC [Candidatus Atribacteria bacterium]|nr:competence protein ComEC [Candidatus Atribacteria bacterium]